MGTLLGMIIGGTFAMLLSGWLVAWLLRKGMRMSYVASCIIGVSIMTFVGAWSITYEGGPSFLQNWITYVICGAIALPILIFGRRGKDSPAPLR